MDWQTHIAKSMPAVVALRHRLHQIPELAYQEFKTAAMIRAELDRLGLEYTAGVIGAPTATITLIGDPTKPCIAFRADIDALPIPEQTGLAYASTHPGKMHACGHDGHSATLVGTAEAILAIADELDVCVKMLWQPAEEGGGGAARLVEAGVLDGRLGPKVKAIFGLHGWPSLPVGTVATKGGALLAATDNFSATFIGQGCHGAFPHTGVDPLSAACEAVCSLQKFVSREFDPTDSAVITVGTINAGTATNIIPDRACFTGTARTLHEAAREQVRHAVERRLRGIAAANACQLDFAWSQGYPPTVNDPTAADYVARTAIATFGSNAFVPIGRPSMGGEDFAYYLEKIPGCFFLVGVAPDPRGAYPSLHNDHYDFTDQAMSVGIRMFVELARNYPKS